MATLAWPDKDVDSEIGVEFLSPSAWSHCCSEAGLVVELCDATDNEKRLPSPETCLKVMEAAVPAFKSGMLTDADLEELKKRYSSGHGREVVFLITMLKVLARKPEVS